MNFAKKEATSIPKRLEFPLTGSGFLRLSRDYKFDTAGLADVHEIAVAATMQMFVRANWEKSQRKQA